MTNICNLPQIPQICVQDGNSDSIPDLIPRSVGGFVPMGSPEGDILKGFHSFLLQAQVSLPEPLDFAF